MIESIKTFFRGTPNPKPIKYKSLKQVVEEELVGGKTKDTLISELLNFKDEWVIGTPLYKSPVIVYKRLGISLINYDHACWLIKEGCTKRIPLSEKNCDKFKDLYYNYLSSQYTTVDVMMSILDEVNRKGREI